MITSDEFKELLVFIQDQDKKELTFMDALEGLCQGEYINAFIYSQYKQKVIELLENMFNDKDEDISYFLYEMDAADHENMIVPDEKCPMDKDKKILYNSPETLYNYLVGKINE